MIDVLGSPSLTETPLKSPVHIDWAQFSLAILLLWFPRQWLRLGGKVIRFRSRRNRRYLETGRSREPGDQSVRFGEEIRKDKNFIDFFRAAVGGVALVGWPGAIDPALQPVELPADGSMHWVYWMLLGVLLAAVLVQTFRYEGRFSLFPALFYLSGLSIALCGLKPALFALVLVWSINLALPSALAFLVVYALLLVVFGLLFVGMEPLPMFAALLCFLPALLSLLMRRSLVSFTKRMKGPAS